MISRRLLAASQARVFAHSGAAIDHCAQAMFGASRSTAALHTTPPQTAAGPSAAAIRPEDTSVPLPRLVSKQEKHRPLPSSLRDALGFVKATAHAKFDETVELGIVLGTDPRRGDHAVRGTATLPHGTGKPVRVCAFAEGADVEAARAAGADVIGDSDLISRIQEEGSSAADFDKVVATPDWKSRLSKVAKVLGPRGLMPNAKLGTLAEDIGAAVRTFKEGRIEFRADRGAVLQAGIGKVSFSDAALEENALALVRAVLAARPKGVKGSGASGYMLRATVASTMGPGFPVSTQSLVMGAQTAGRAAGGR